jgi:hypothetical protein
MSRLEHIRRYEEESGNTVLNDDKIVDSMGHYIGKFTIQLAKNYHEIINETD